MDLKIKKKIPYSFVLDELGNAVTFIRPMFGAHALYRDEKMILILRKKDDYLRDNGVWIATVPEHHASLKKDFKSMRSIELFGMNKPSAWQNLPEDSPHFEDEVLKACAFILKRDERIGKVPKSRKKQKK